MIKEGDFVIRTTDTPWKAEGFLWHPLSFGQVTEFIKCDHKTRPTGTDRPAEWTEIVIRPFDNRMAPDGAWLQWVKEECVVIKPWFYCLLGLSWPLLRRIYTKPLKGQHTEYNFFRLIRIKKWRARLGLNRWPLRCQRSALPLSYAPSLNKTLVIPAFIDCLYLSFALLRSNSCLSVTGLWRSQIH